MARLYKSASYFKRTLTTPLLNMPFLDKFVLVAYGYYYYCWRLSVDKFVTRKSACQEAWYANRMLAQWWLGDGHPLRGSITAEHMVVWSGTAPQLCDIHRHTCGLPVWPEWAKCVISCRMISPNIKNNISSGFLTWWELGLKKTNDVI